MRNSGNIDIHMIPSEEGAQPKRESLEERLARTPWQDFGIALGIAAGVTGFSLLIVDFIDYRAVALFYLFAVVLAGMRLRRWPTFFLAALSALLWNFLFIPPRFTFYISKLRRLHDVRRVLCYRRRHRTSGDAIARTRTSRAPPRRTRHRACIV